MNEEAEMLTLLRTSKTTGGVFGNLLRNGSIIAVTCEPPDNHNEPSNSCVPEACYTCIPHSGDKFQNVWELTDVPGRSAILIHNGNTIKDTHGCILVGSTFGWLKGQKAVINSVATLDHLRATLPPIFRLNILCN